MMSVSVDPPPAYVSLTTPRKFSSASLDANDTQSSPATAGLTTHNSSVYRTVRQSAAHHSSGRFAPTTSSVSATITHQLSHEERLAFQSARETLQAECDRVEKIRKALEASGNAGSFILRQYLQAIRELESRSIIATTPRNIAQAVQLLEALSEDLRTLRTELVESKIEDWSSWVAVMTAVHGSLVGVAIPQRFILPPVPPPQYESLIADLDAAIALQDLLAGG